MGVEVNFVGVSCRLVGDTLCPILLDYAYIGGRGAERELESLVRSKLISPKIESSTLGGAGLDEDIWRYLVIGNRVLEDAIESDRNQRMDMEWPGLSSYSPGHETICNRLRAFREDPVARWYFHVE